MTPILIITMWIWGIGIVAYKRTHNPYPLSDVLAPFIVGGFVFLIAGTIVIGIGR